MTKRHEGRALVAGYFSTVGDVETLRVVERQLRAMGIAYDVGAFVPQVNTAIERSVCLRAVDPAAYDRVLLVCGPYNPEFYEWAGFDLDRFAHCTRIGVNLTLLGGEADAAGLDVLVGRDSDESSRADLSFLLEVDRHPVVGLCLARFQTEYGDRARHDLAERRLRELIARSGVAVVPLDTEWPETNNLYGVGSPEQYAAICARLDVVLTTRLHGMVIALKNGVPALAVDAVAGGHKLTRQAEAIGWTEAFRADDVTDEELDAALARCLGPDAKARAVRCADDAAASLDGFEAELVEAMRLAPPVRATAAANARQRRGWIDRLGRSTTGRAGGVPIDLAVGSSALAEVALSGLVII